MEVIMSQLSSKMYKEFSYLSRYSATPCYYHRNDQQYVTALSAYLKDTTPYNVHVVEENNETFDSIALQYYNNPTLYWILCSFNHIQNPYKALKKGDRIKIPVLSNIEFDFEGRN